MANIFLDLAHNALTGGDDIAAVTTNVAGASVDFKDVVGNRGNCLMYVSTVSGTTPVLTAKIQESTDGTTWTDVTGATYSTVTTSNNRQIISFNTLKRYVRGYDTVSGTTPSFLRGRTFLAQRRTTPNSALGGGWTNEAGASV